MTSKDTKNTYVITGATSGIGLAKKGYDLIGIGRSQERCEIQSKCLQESFPGIRLEYLVADLSIQQDIHAVVKEITRILSDWGKDGLDGLINNAGTFTY